MWSVPLRIFILWVYNNTAKSLFAAIVMHATINLSSSSPFIPRVIALGPAHSRGADLDCRDCVGWECGAGHFAARRDSREGG